MAALDLREHCIGLLAQRGVLVADLAECAVFLQKAHFHSIDPKEMEDSVLDVLGKREVQYAIMTGIALDKMAEEGKIDDPLLQEMIMTDEGLYGIDEVLAYSICNVYGSIALTNFGFIDKAKYGIVGELNQKVNGSYPGHCHTFLDDIAGAIAASAAARFAHAHQGDEI